MSINNSQLPKFTEHIRAAPSRLPIELYIKFCEAHRKDPPKQKPRPHKKTAKAIVGLDVIEVSTCLEDYWPVPTEKVKQAIRERDNYTCQICGEWGNFVDHINPLRISHDSSPENLRVLCRYHNIITRMQRRDARLEYDEWIKLLRESLMPPVNKQIQLPD